jgi:hypothetical protein
MCTAVGETSQSNPDDVPFPCRDANNRIPRYPILPVLIVEKMLFNESKKKSGSRMHRRLVMRH